jgi:hypothetical protein
MILMDTIRGMAWALVLIWREKILRNEKVHWVLRCLMGGREELVERKADGDAAG